MKCIIRYLKGTVHLGIQYTKQKLKECVCYSDADWAGDVIDQKSMSVHLLQISGGLISWRSKKQSSIALSTTEAEYMTLTSSAQECLWLRQLNTELEGSTTEPLTIYEYNQSTISITRNLQFHGCSNHIAIKSHFYPREHVILSNEAVRLEYIVLKKTRL